MTTTEQPAIKTRPSGERNGHRLHETADGMKSLYATKDGSTVVGGAWGPSADGDGNWFCYRAGQNPIRVESRDAAIDHITTEEN